MMETFSSSSFYDIKLKRRRLNEAMGLQSDGESIASSAPSTTEGDFHSNNDGDYHSNNEGDFSSNNEGDLSSNNEGDLSSNNEGDLSSNNEGDSHSNSEGDFSSNNEGYTSSNYEGHYPFDPDASQKSLNDAELRQKRAFDDFASSLRQDVKTPAAFLESLVPDQNSLFTQYTPRPTGFDSHRVPVFTTLNGNSRVPLIQVSLKPPNTDFYHGRTEQDERDSVCAICKDSASGLHYGVVTCEGCKGFFKRTVQNRRVYKCVSRGMCVIDKLQRNRCQYCRFKKCLQSGMVTAAVREDRTPGGRNSGALYNLSKVRYRKHKKKIQPREHKNLPAGNKSTTIVTAPAQQAWHAMAAGVTRIDNMTDITSPPQHHITMEDADVILSFKKQALEARVCELTDGLVSGLVTWARQLSFFHEISIHDWTRILKLRWHAMLVLCLTKHEAACIRATMNSVDIGLTVSSQANAATSLLAGESSQGSNIENASLGTTYHSIQGTESHHSLPTGDGQTSSVDSPITSTLAGTFPAPVLHNGHSSPVTSTPAGTFPAAGHTSPVLHNGHSSPIMSTLAGRFPAAGHSSPVLHNGPSSPVTSTMAGTFPVLHNSHSSPVTSTWPGMSSLFSTLLDRYKQRLEKYLDKTNEPRNQCRDEGTKILAMIAEIAVTLSKLQLTQAEHGMLQVLILLNLENADSVPNVSWIRQQYLLALKHYELSMPSNQGQRYNNLLYLVALIHQASKLFQENNLLFVPFILASRKTARNSRDNCS